MLQRLQHMDGRAGAAEAHRSAQRRGAGLTTAVLLTVLGALGCAHHVGNFAQELAEVDYPAWVLRGSGPAKLQDGPAFLGVGQVSGMRNVALARSTADNRARAELAKSYELFAATLLAAWSNDQNAGPHGAEQQKADRGDAAKGRPAPAVTLVAEPVQPSGEEAVKMLAAAALPAVQVVEHWFHPTDGAVFSLARLELAQVLENLARMRELPLPLRTWLKAHMAEQHDVWCEQRLHQDNVAPRHEGDSSEGS